MRINPAKFKQARLALDLTQAELASRAGLEQSHISYVERGVKGLSLDMLRKAAKALGVEVGDLVIDDEDPSTATYPRFVGAGANTLQQLRQDERVPPGLRELAGDKGLIDSLAITEEEWQALASIRLPGHADKNGYTHLLLTVRAICE